TAAIAIVVSCTAAIPAAAMVPAVAGRGIFALARTTATITVVARGAPAIATAIAIVAPAALAAGAVTVAVVARATIAIAIALAGSRRVLAVARTATAIAIVAGIARLTRRRIGDEHAIERHHRGLGAAAGHLQGDIIGHHCRLS